MELHKLDAISILFPHHRPSQPSCRKCFSHTGRALQDDILLVAKNGHKTLVAFFGHIDLIEKIIFRICFNRRFDSYRILFANEIENELILAFGEFEQAPLRVLEIFHAFQLRVSF